MIRLITLVISWALLPLAMIAVAWGIAKDFIEEKVDG
jgi:hypothetical protein